MKYKIKKAEAGIRLDKFLVARLKGKTRGQAQNLIGAGLVLVGGKIASNHYPLKIGEEVEIKKERRTRSEERKLAVEPKIIFANREFIVVDKPAGLIVHGAPHIKGPTLADWLVKKYPELKKVGEDKSRPGIMHRLDKDVSGLLVVARTDKSFANLKRQFQKREVEKIYTALVYGAVAKENDQINFSLKRAAGGFRQAAIPAGYNFKENFTELREAFTEFRVLRRFVNYTLLEVKIKSGRKHQIRVHLFAYGYPLVGDNLYSTKKTREMNRKINLGRIFLAATSLSFRDSAGEKHSFRAPLPPELTEFLDRLN
ncbi:MAG TPA: RluA family pseudouridine synthase [Candidatus Methylomirabilis sp.]|nr:RluA family pseudouridine synthase [Candidatus Methylomirabilis sp.]